VGLPEARLPRYLGYAWSFATITPGILFTYEFLSTSWPDRPGGRQPISSCWFYPTVVAGLLCVSIPLLSPSPYMTPLVWIGFVLFLDPLNGRLGMRSIMAELFAGRPKSMGLLFLSGLICGFLWEFWNYWARAKWQYSVPYWGEVKLFEMPLLGYLGFLPFAVECFALYKFIRRILPIPDRENYLG